MMKIFFVCMFLVGLLSVSNQAQGNNLTVAEYKSISVGGSQIIIPPPTKEMVPLDNDNQRKFEPFIAPDSKLIASFVFIDELPKIESNNADIIQLLANGTVQVPLQGEFKEFSDNDFKRLIANSQQRTDSLGSYTQIAEEEINRRIKSINRDASSVNLGDSIELGSFFSVKDAFGLGLITPVSVGGKSMLIGKGAVMIRVKDRLLFLYLSTEYKNVATIDWLRYTTEEWANSILKANN